MTTQTTDSFRTTFTMYKDNKIRVVDLTECFNCKACENSCRKRHKYERNVRDGKREGHFILPIACRQCDDPVCVKACKKGAHIKENGISYIKQELCVGCGRCAKTCPYGSIKVIKEGKKGGGNLIVKCDLCKGFKNRACFSSCPQVALKLVNENFD